MARRSGGAVRRLAARGLLAALLAAAPAGAEGPPGPAEGSAEAPGPDEAEAAPAAVPAEGEEAPEPEAAPRRPRYESVDPGDRRGRTFDPAELRTDSSEPSFGAATEDLGEHRGETWELRELSRPPGPREPEPEVEVPAPLRLRRPPGEELPRSAPLPVRLCDAEEELAHARLQRLDAVAAYKRARRAEYPRGDAKALVVKRRELTGNRLGRAEGALDALLDEAAEQGVDFDPAECPGA